MKIELHVERVYFLFIYVLSFYCVKLHLSFNKDLCLNIHIRIYINIYSYTSLILYIFLHKYIRFLLLKRTPLHKFERLSITFRILQLHSRHRVVVLICKLFQISYFSLQVILIVYFILKII